MFIDCLVEYQGWVKDLLAETDRGCVIIAHAMLEATLVELVKAHLAAEPNGFDLLCTYLRDKQQNPFMRLKSCVEYASDQLCLIDNHTRNALEALNEIRIPFAHYGPRDPLLQLNDVQKIFNRLSPEQQVKTKQPQMLSAAHEFTEKAKGIRYSDARKHFAAIVAVLMGDLLVLYESINPHRNPSSNS